MTTRKRVLDGLPFDPSDDDAISAFRHQNLGRSLANATEAFEAQVRRNLESMGLVEGLSAVHIETARCLDLEGTRLSELARRTGLSKQYIGSVVRDLREAGIVAIEADPSDGRARLVRFTAAGRAGLLVGLEAIARIVEETEQAIGGANVRELQETLNRLTRLWSGDPSR